jgi:hypothetical protein
MVPVLNVIADFVETSGKFPEANLNRQEYR